MACELLPRRRRLENLHWDQFFQMYLKKVKLVNCMFVLHLVRAAGTSGPAACCTARRASGSCSLSGLIFSKFDYSFDKPDFSPKENNIADLLSIPDLKFIGRV